jgi:glycosyltransferase involved in cell wall biosynthesis
MRVTFLLPYAGLSGGIRVVAHVAEHLQQRGHDVAVIALPRERPKLRANLRQFLRTRHWPQSPPPERSHFDNVTVERRILDRYRPILDDDVPEADVVVATWWETAEWAASLSAWKGAKAYFLQQYEANFGFPEDRVAATWRLPMHKIVASRWLADLAKSRFNDPVCSIVPNGVDYALFHAPPRGRQPVPTVGLMYSTAAVKGCDVSLAAVHTVKQHLANLKLLTFGMDELSDRLPLPDGTHYVYMPTQEQIREAYAQCDVWLCGSRSEGFHLPPHEAMACRCPVVSSRVGGPMDMIRDGVNGYVVDCEDAVGLADRLLKVLTLSDARWRQMSDAALATARQFSWEVATDRFESALELAVERARRREIAGGVALTQGVQS